MINPQHYTFAILVMAMITFVVRYVFFTTSFQLKLTPQMKNILTFTAPCVLTAMIVPIMFQDMLALLNSTAGGHGVSESIQPIAQASSQSASDSNNYPIITSLLGSSYFWASIFAIIASLFIRQTLLVILLSMTVFYGLRLFVFA